MLLEESGMGNRKPVQFNAFSIPWSPFPVPTTYSFAQVSFRYFAGEDATDQCTSAAESWRCEWPVRELPPARPGARGWWHKWWRWAGLSRCVRTAGMEVDSGVGIDRLTGLFAPRAGALTPSESGGVHRGNEAAFPAGTTWVAPVYEVGIAEGPCVAALSFDHGEKMYRAPSRRRGQLRRGVAKFRRGGLAAEMDIHPAK